MRTWYDKTCGINGHGACAEEGQIGYRVNGDDGTGIFEPIEYAWNNGDENATYMTFCIVRANLAAQMPEPAGGAFPTTFMANIGAICNEVTRSTLGNTCFLDLPTPSASPMVAATSPIVSPMDDGNAGEDGNTGGADGVTSSSTPVARSSTGPVTSTDTTSNSDAYNNSYVQGNSATASTSTLALLATGFIAALVTVALINRH